MQLGSKSIRSCLEVFKGKTRTWLLLLSVYASFMRDESGKVDAQNVEHP